MAIGNDTFANGIQSPKTLESFEHCIGAYYSNRRWYYYQVYITKTLGSFERFTLLAFPAIVPSTVGITEMKLSHFQNV